MSVRDNRQTFAGLGFAEGVKVGESLGRIHLPVGSQECSSCVIHFLATAFNFDKALLLLSSKDGYCTKNFILNIFNKISDHNYSGILIKAFHFVNHKLKELSINTLMQKSLNLNY